MSNLKADLDNYLKSGNSSSSTGSLASLSSSWNLPTLKSPFGSTNNDGNNEDTEILIGDSENPSSSSSSSSSTCCNKCITNFFSFACQWFPPLTKKQRIGGFMGCLLLGSICFGLAFFIYLPLILIQARKFALLFSLGSLFTMSSFSFLWGPTSHITHLMSTDRLPFTSIYLITLFATLYFAMGLQSTILTTVAAIAQICALSWFVISYIPGGKTGLKFFTRISTSLCKSTVGKSLPI